MFMVGSRGTRNSASPILAVFDRPAILIIHHPATIVTTSGMMQLPTPMLAVVTARRGYDGPIQQGTIICRR